MRLLIRDVEKAVGLQTNLWQGRCYEIALRMLRKIPELKEAGAVAVYGHWIGPIAPTSYFAPRRNFGFTQHGWLSLPGSRVIDPTRWVFEAVEPYIYDDHNRDPNECVDFEPSIGDERECMHCGHEVSQHLVGMFRPCKLCLWPYDEGGNRLRARRKTPAPKKNPGDKLVGLLGKLPPLAKQHVAMLFGRTLDSGALDELSVQQCMWLANLPYEELEPYVKSVYKGIEDVGQRALIPVDNYRRALRQKHGEGSW